jgi:hypothetical protein
MAIDTSNGYKQIQKKLESSKTYKQLVTDYKKSKKKAGSSFEQSNSQLSQRISKISGETKNKIKQTKTQLDELLDIFDISGSKSLTYLKSRFLLALKNKLPEIFELLLEESISAVGCDQQQTYYGNPSDQNGSLIYVKVSSIDLFGLLKTDPSTKVGKLLYEKGSFTVQNNPFQMNKLLYSTIQSSNSYYSDYGQNYLGISGQELFNIKYVEINPNTGIGGGWYEISLKNRLNANIVSEFFVDYYKTIKIFDDHNVISWVMDALVGCLSIKLGDGDLKINDKSKFYLIIQRILGLCFDSRTEIDTSGISKLSQNDGIDDSLFEFTEIDLRNIDQRLNNIKNGVATFESCDNIELPINTDGLIDNLENLIYTPDTEYLNSVNNLNSFIIQEPQNELVKKTFGVQVFDKDFIKKLINGIAAAILSPKILLPIFIMIKATQKTVDDTISTISDFCKEFKKFTKELISKIASIFIKELFNIIKKDIKNLVMTILSDINKEKIRKKYGMIVVLTKALIAIGTTISLIRDWRRCKSVIDELQILLSLIEQNRISKGRDIPLPLVLASRLLDGFSKTRAFIGTIQELQDLGIPTGPMPDGSPNLTMLAMYAQINGYADELADNGKVQIGVNPLTVTPIGVTVPKSVYGKFL